MYDDVVVQSIRRNNKLNNNTVSKILKIFNINSAIESPGILFKIAVFHI